MIIKAITLWQPWASLVAIGSKRIETRSWSTSYRGLLAIHAAKRFPKEAMDLCQLDPFRGALWPFWNRLGFVVVNALPRGSIVAVCELQSLVEITATNAPTEPELSFGDYAPGRWAWYLENVKELLKPILARGKQRLWNWEVPAEEAK
jgi:hypothetical protein